MSLDPCTVTKDLATDVTSLATAGELNKLRHLNVIVSVRQVKSSVVSFGVLLLLVLDLAVGGNTSFSASSVDVVVLLQQLGKGVSLRPLYEQHMTVYRHFSHFQNDHRRHHHYSHGIVDYGQPTARSFPLLLLLPFLLLLSKLLNASR